MKKMTAVKRCKETFTYQTSKLCLHLLCSPYVCLLTLLKLTSKVIIDILIIYMCIFYVILLWYLEVYLVNLRNKGFYKMLI